MWLRGSARPQTVYVDECEAGHSYAYLLTRGDNGRRGFIECPFCLTDLNRLPGSPGARHCRARAKSAAVKPPAAESIFS